MENVMANGESSTSRDREARTVSEVNGADRLAAVRIEVDALAGGLHVLSDALAHRRDADLSAQALLLARQLELVAELVERMARDGGEDRKG